MNLVRTIRVPDFKPQRIPSLYAADFRDQPEHAQWPHVQIDAGRVLEGQAAVQTKGANVIISRQALLSDSAGQIGAVAASYGNVAALTIASAIAAALSATAVLDDGVALFATSTDNLVTAGGAPSVTTLSTGATKLWRQVTPVGTLAAVAPAYLVIPPELLADASTALLDMFGDINSARGNIDLVVLPHLTSAVEWYLLGRPASAPVLAMLTLDGESPLTIERLPSPLGIDGIALRARLDFRILRLSRLGAFKNDGA